MKKVYICSPCRGDYENNIQRAKEFSRAAVERGCIPITPHIYLTQFMDDTVPAERELGLSIGRELVLMCDELWAFGLDCPTAGMAAEIELARERGIPVLNGFKAISEIPETEKQDEDPQDAGSVIIRVPASDINVYKRDVQGVIVMRIEEGNQLVAIERIEKDEEESE